MKIFVIFAILLACVGGCTQESIKKESEEDLEKQVEELQNEIDSLKTSINDLEMNVVWDLIEKKVARFTPGSKGYYLTVGEQGHSFLISLDKVSKYANGYKVIFSIGNPALIEFNRLELVVGWGEELFAGKREKIKINKPILPGAWNRVEVVLSPATEIETGHITVMVNTIDADVVLAEDFRKDLN